MTAILLIQLFKEPPLGISTLERDISQLAGSQLVALDNFSDGSILAYVRKMIEDSETVTAIIWEFEGGTLKGMQPLFNAMLKKKQAVSLITNSSQGVIARLSKAIDSHMVQDEAKLMEVLNQP